MDIFIWVTSWLSNLVTIITGAIAIYIFIAKRKEVKLLFNALINYSYQTTLHELKGKLERLNEYNADDTNDRKEIINIFHEIAGQIRGNVKLSKSASTCDLLRRIEEMLQKRTVKISEPHKRALVSEIREVIRHLDLDSIENYMKE